MAIQQQIKTSLVAADTTVSSRVKRKKRTANRRLVVLFGAGDEARTRYLDLGKVALYQMSYARKSKTYYSGGSSVCQPLIFTFSK